MTINSPPILAILVPCFNEQEVLSHTAVELMQVLNTLTAQQKIAAKSFICFIDDGSFDTSWELIQTLHSQFPQIKGIKLSRNFGHQNALFCGLMHCKDKADCLISIDADLQDDIHSIEKFIAHYQQGYQIVYGVREKRDVDTYFKKFTAHCFYKIMGWLGTQTIPQHADFRLISSKVAMHLANFNEFNLFLRGLFPLIGFKTAAVTYERKERLAGESKYPLRKMLSFSLDAITSFSVSPLRCIALLGVLFFISSILMSIYIVLQAKVLHETIPGWASTVLPIYFIGGIQLLSIGIIGEYVGKIYAETKARPRYIVETELLHDE